MSAIALYWAAQVSLEALCATEIAMMAVFALVSLGWVDRLVQVSAIEVFRAVRVPLLAVVGAGLPLLAGRLVAPPSLGTEPALGFAAIFSALAAALYASALFLVGGRKPFAELRDLALLFVGRSGGSKRPDGAPSILVED
jgi:hypothetical protein